MRDSLRAAKSRLNSLKLYKSKMYVNNPLVYNGTAFPSWDMLQTKFVCIDINVTICSEMEPMTSRGVPSSLSHLSTHYIKSDSGWKGFALIAFFFFFGK